MVKSAGVSFELDALVVTTLSPQLSNKESVALPLPKSGSNNNTLLPLSRDEALS